MRKYLGLAEVLAIHHDQIERYGGSHGVRDAGLLEAAIFRPQSGYYSGLTGEAAALWESLSQNHPFLDGNKRTAFAAMYTFLLIDGARIEATEEETIEFVLGLYEAGAFRFENLEHWLREHCNATAG